MKKIIGFVFLMIGALLSLGFMMSLPKTLGDIFGKSKTGTTYDTAYIFGVICGVLFMAIIAFFFIKLGLKWISKKPVTSEVDDIGRN